MTFTSLSFLLLLAGTLLLFFLFPSRLRWLVLLMASYYFYASLKAPYLLLALGAVTLISYGCGMLMQRSPREKVKALWLWGGILADISLLVWLKYLPFVSENLNILLEWLAPGLRLAPPHLVAIGASYFVFQGISYLIDIYLGELEPERHPGYFALSMSFFPKLLQGPIERSGRLLPQLHELRVCNWEDIRAGSNLFLVGMFKKQVIADRLATLVDPVYGQVHAHSPLQLLLATYLFALQLYFDFSGYTDMALGIARLFNIRLTENFNAPYLATSCADFWRRWHISFSSWILDYIFKPLQFQTRSRRWGTYFALMITFLASGLWHGASWCFVAWGALHGVYLSVGALVKKPKQKLLKKLGLERSRPLRVWQTVITFHLVCFSWIFFRARNLGDAGYVAKAVLLDLPSSLRQWATGAESLEQELLPAGASGELAFALAAMVLITALTRIDPSNVEGGVRGKELAWLSESSPVLQGCCYGIFIYLILLHGARAQGFIYLQF